MKVPVEKQLDDISHFLMSLNDGLIELGTACNERDVESIRETAKQLPKRREIEKYISRIYKLLETRPWLEIEPPDDE